MHATKTLLHCVAFIGILMSSAAFAQVTMLPPVQSGSTDTVCSPSTSGKLLSWDGASSIKCQTGLIVDSSGKVGVGTSSPSAQLDVAGTLNVSGTTSINSGLAVASGVKIGTDTAICTTVKAGTIRYNGGQLEVCNGKSWINPSAGLTYVGSCTTPKSGSKNTSCKCGANETLMLMSGFNGTGNWGDSVNCRVTDQNTTSVLGYAYYAASVSGTCTFACFK